MSKIAGVPGELRVVADVARRAALEYAADASYLGSRWLPSMPAGMAALATSALSSAASELRDQAVGLVAGARDLDLAAYWFELAGEGSAMAFIYPPGYSLERAHELLAGVGADPGSPTGLDSWGFADWTGIDPATTSPAEVAAAFAALSAAQKEFLTLSFPDVVGSLDGAPLELRFAANRMRIEAAVDELESEVADARADLDRMRMAGGVIAGPLGAWALEHAPLNPLGGAADRLAFLEQKLELIRGWAADESRRFLLFDPTGDGRAAEVLGPIETADHIAILVPGMGNEITDFDGLAANARRLQERAAFFAGTDVATIAWLGYDTPTVKDVMFAGKAEAAAPLLDAFVDGLRPHRDVHYSVVAHSYGGVATGLSLKHGLDVDDVAFIGVPGTGPGIGSLAELETTAQVWAGKARFMPDLDVPDLFDPRALLGNISEMEFVPTLGPLGEDPTEPSYGAKRFRVNLEGIELEIDEGSTGNDGIVMGHSQYYKQHTLSLDNLAHIVADQDDAVDDY